MADKGFYQYKNGERIYMPEGIISINKESYDPNYEYDVDNYLVGVYIPRSVKYIESNAFQEAYQLTAVAFETDSLLEYIGERAFESCQNLKGFEFTKLGNLRSIGFGAFSRTNIKEVDLSNCTHLSHVGTMAFQGMDNLETVKWSTWGNVNSSGDWCKVIPSWGFSECYNLHSFYGCKDGAKLIPIEYIGEAAFRGCDNLKEFKVHSKTMVGADNAPIENFFTGESQGEGSDDDEDDIWGIFKFPKN